LGLAFQASCIKSIAVRAVKIFISSEPNLPD
jgi:hypothetical protein